MNAPCSSHTLTPLTYLLALALHTHTHVLDAPGDRYMHFPNAYTGKHKTESRGCGCDCCSTIQAP